MQHDLERIFNVSKSKFLIEYVQEWKMYQFRNFTCNENPIYCLPSCNWTMMALY